MEGRFRHRSNSVPSLASKSSTNDLSESEIALRNRELDLKEQELILRRYEIDNRVTTQNSTKKVDLYRIKNVTKFEGRNTQEQLDWTLEIERHFAAAGLAGVVTIEEEAYRSKWALDYFGTKARRYWSQQDQLGNGKMTWSSIKEIAKNLVSDPTTRQSRVALAFYNVNMRLNQDVSSFFAYASAIEQDLAGGLLPEPWRWQFYFTRLPETIRQEMIRTCSMEKIKDTKDLIEWARGLEQAARLQRPQVARNEQQQRKEVPRREHDYTTSNKAQVMCHKCEKFGHYANHCPNPAAPGRDRNAYLKRKRTENTTFIPRGNEKNGQAKF